MRILWKIIKVLGNIFGILTSIVVSLALLVMLVATPLVSVVSAFTKPETVRQVVDSIDFRQIVRDSLSGVIQVADEKEFEILMNLTETKAFGELVELYVTDLTGILDTEEKPSALTEEALRQIMEDNIDELVDMARSAGESLGEDISSYTDEEIEAQVRELFDEVVDRFLELAPSVEDLQNLIVRIVEGFAANPVLGVDAPGSNAEYIEDEYDNWQDTPSFEESDGTGSVIMPGEDGIVSVIIPGDGGIIQNENGENYYVTVDPETGAVKIEDANGNAVDEENVIINSSGGTAISGFVTFGHPVALRGSSIRVLSMGLSAEGGVQSGVEVAEEIIRYMSAIFTMLQNGTFTSLLVGIIVVLALLLCLLRWPRFKGFIWVAIVLLIAAAFLALVAGVVTFMPSAVVSLLGMAGITGAEALVSTVMPVISVFTGNVFIAAGIYAVVGIVLIILFIIFRVILKKRKKAKAAKAKAKAMEAIADDAEANAIAAKAEAQPEPEEVAAEEEEELEEEEVPSEEESPEGIAAE